MLPRPFPPVDFPALNYIELVGVVFGFLAVYYNIRQNIWCWPTGLVNVSLFFVMFYQARLYADMGLQVFYFVLSVYGWYYWLHGGRGGREAPVRRLRLRPALLLGVLGAAATVGIGWGLATYTDADLPYWDALTTVGSIIGQGLLAKKLLENWLVWIGVDVLSVAIYYYKGLYLTTLLFAAFLVMAVMGYVAWKRSMAAPAAPVPAAEAARA